MMKFMTKKNLAILAAVAVVLIPVIAFAINAPTNSGEPFYDVYDIIVNKFLKGSVGFVTAVIAIIAGFALAFQQKFLPGVVSIALGIVMIKADTLVISMGALL